MKSFQNEKLHEIEFFPNDHLYLYKQQPHTVLNPIHTRLIICNFSISSFAALTTVGISFNLTPMLNQQVSLAETVINVIA